MITQEEAARINDRFKHEYGAKLERLGFILGGGITYPLKSKASIA